jgi:hypothetical protein
MATRMKWRVANELAKFWLNVRNAAFQSNKRAWALDAASDKARELGWIV